MRPKLLQLTIAFPHGELVETIELREGSQLNIETVDPILHRRAWSFDVATITAIHLAKPKRRAAA